MPVSTLSSALDQALWLGVLSICAVILVVTLWRKRRDGVVTPGEVMREQRARLRDQREICRTTEELLGRLEQTIQRSTSAADEQAARLTRLIRDADERLDRLAPLINAVDGLRSRLSRATHSVPALSATPRIAATDDSLAEDPIAEPGMTASAARLAPLALATRVFQPLRTAPPPVDPGPRPAAPARFAPVYDLADAGRSPAEIAAALRLPQAEVELVLNLRSFA